jgi:CubicO group peptidase (beta-lactamase class C family)
VRRILGTALVAASLIAGGGAVAAFGQQPPPPPASGPAPALPDMATARARLEARLARLADEDGFEGVVRVDIGGRTVMRTGVGLADPVLKVPFTADTQVEMGSIAKSFTATAILRLKDQGRLGLDDPLSKFVPGVPADKAGVTLRQLLTHSAGFPHDVARDDEALDRAGLEKRALAAPLLFAPGKGWSYSNVGFALLADVVERVSGKVYEDFLVDDILRPAGILHTGYRRAYDPALAERTDEGHAIPDDSWGGGPYWGIMGNGGLMTTADDMAAFRAAFMAGRIVSPASVLEATTGGADEGPGRPERYGFGVGLMPHPLYGRMIWHNGGNPFFTSDFRQLEDRGVFIFVSGNSREGASDAAGKLLRALFGLPDPVFDAAATPPGKLAQAFVAAAQDPDPAHRRAFVVARFGPGFVGRVGLEQRVKDFDALHETLKGRTLKRIQGGTPDQAYAVFDPPESGRRLAVQVDMGIVVDGDQKIGGWRLRR